ncbi:DUF4352 domain-containing protein [Nocardioides alcanivorans]|uniref:DUF4352 domain-containing protein n=1 Tax=Nocardioides alcanivorans TaxID=2897352 RepID=UPI001F35527B|nr:DUF4352 domain-containing protein [Nocardioides alcanivorans]
MADGKMTRMRLNRTLGIAALLLALGATSACDGSEKEAEVKEEGDRNAKIVQSDADDAVDAADEEASEEPEVDNASVQLGDTVILGDWEVKVTKVQVNADADIKQANPYNDKPTGQYVLATYEATYVGDERKADVTFDLTWSFTGTDNQVYENSYSVTPGSEWPTEARAGGTVKQDVAFDVPKGVIKGGTLGVEAMDSDFETVFADFVVN